MKRITRMLRLFAPLMLLSGAMGCGDIGNVQVSVGFPDNETELRTRSLLLVVREVPTDRSGCDDLWSDRPTGLAESRSLVEYPNRNPIVGAPVKLDMYQFLTLMVFAYPSTDTETSRPLAGGCIETQIDAENTSEVNITMEMAPR